MGFFDKLGGVLLGAGTGATAGYAGGGGGLGLLLGGAYGGVRGGMKGLENPKKLVYQTAIPAGIAGLALAPSRMATEQALSVYKSSPLQVAPSPLRTLSAQASIFGGQLAQIPGFIGSLPAKGYNAAKKVTFGSVAKEGGKTGDGVFSGFSEGLSKFFMSGGIFALPSLLAGASRGATQVFGQVPQGVTNLLSSGQGEGQLAPAYQAAPLPVPLPLGGGGQNVGSSDNATPLLLLAGGLLLFLWAKSR